MIKPEMKLIKMLEWKHKGLVYIPRPNLLKYSSSYGEVSSSRN